MRHPVHPAVVHFPIACWTLATIGDVASLWLGKPAWWWAGVSLALGTTIAIFAMITGMIEILRIANQKQRLKVAERHMQLILLAWTVYATSLFMRLDGFRLTEPGIIEIGLSCLGFVILSIASWFGAQLVYKYGVGLSDS
ncbi:MAG: DUF2231 domain-containing protein [Pseudomonadota bacterium]